MSSLQSTRIRLLIGGLIVFAIALGAFSLARNRTPPRDAGRNSIAVLAFENFGDDAANEF